jgi:flagellar basal-body rod protein FlgG
VLQGLYSAAAGMAAQQQRLDAISNDVANVSTAGYKRTRLAFRDLAYTEVPAGNGVRAGAGAAAMDAGRSQAQGALQSTGQPLDVAIEGDGYLQVRRPDGTVALTRQGALRIDGARNLTTALGDLVEPRITVPQDVAADDLAIRPDGTVTGNGRELGRLRVVDVPAPDGLLALGDSVLAPTAASGGVRDAVGASVRQGVLEGSNVDLGDSMVDMMEAQRAFTLASRAIQTQDQLMEIANGVKR